MRVYVYTRDGVREVRGGGTEGDVTGDIAADIYPGEAFCGVAYADLTDGTYALDGATVTLSRID